MIAIFFIYGLAFFCLGLAVALEARRASNLPLRRQLPWLAAFGIVHALVEWADMFLLTDPGEPYQTFFLLTRTILLPVSALLLIRFGVGLIAETGPLPLWLWVVPLVLAAPAAILIARALISATVDPFLAIDVWSRYLLYFLGSLLSAIGFFRQRQILTEAGIREASNLMLAAALLFLFNAVVAGLIVPLSSYGLAPWLNYDTVLAATGVPVQFWRMLSAVLLTIFVIRALDVFEAQRRQALKLADTALRESEERFRTIFEMAPFGMDIVSAQGQPIQANLALQQMLGYTADELRGMVYTDYTHADDVAPSQQLVREIGEGRRAYGSMQKRYFHKDGSVVWGNVGVSAVRNASDELLYYIAMVEDITRRKEMEETLARERERAQAAELRAQSMARETAEQWFEALVEISRRISHIDSVDDVLVYIVGRTGQLLCCDTVSMGLLDESGAALQLEYQSIGGQSAMLEPPQTVRNRLLLDMLASGRSYRFPDDVELLQVSRAEAMWHCTTTGELVQTAAVVPLEFDGRLVGGIWVGRFQPDPFTPTDLVGLESIADQAVVALQHALMAARLQSLAVLEERSRIAREMHDGLAQVLGYLSLQVQTLDALVGRGENEKALAELKKTRENIKVAQADVRENILSLRTTLAESGTALSALTEYVTEFGLQTGKKTAVLSAFEGTPNLSPLAEVQMVRIVQEALANVRKHAWAETVQVTLVCDDGCLKISVADDGIGFRERADRRSFGLETMRERAEMVGGRLTVTSVLAEGTRIDLWLPLLPERAPGNR